MNCCRGEPFVYAPNPVVVPSPSMLDQIDFVGAWGEPDPNMIGACGAVPPNFMTLFSKSSAVVGAAVGTCACAVGLVGERTGGVSFGDGV